MLAQPDFSTGVLEREKARVVAGLKEAETRPEEIASKAFMAALYGAHPYGRPAAEIGPVEKLGSDDLRRFHQARFKAGSAVVALVGDLGRSEADEIARRLTGGLPKGTAELALPAPVPPKAALEKDIPHPAKQSHILIGYLGISRDDPDYYPLVVGNYVLGGGGFASRLMAEVREKRGLAYSVYSYFDPAREKGPFVIGLQTQRAQTQEALAVTRATLRRFVAEGPTQDELAKARQNIVLGFPLRIDSNAKILGYLALIGFYDLPASYLDDYVRQVERVRVEDVKSAFGRRVDAGRMVTVVVGGGAD
jgi:zinc protease